MRTILILIAFLCAGNFAEGQNVDSISKIIFRYGRGGNSFGQAGIFDREEIVEIQHIRNSFKITKFQQITRTDKGDGSKFISDTVNYKVEYPIADMKIKKLLISLKTPKNNFDSVYVKQHLITPTKRSIISISKQYGLDFKFDFEDKDNDSKKERNDKMRKIQRFDKLGYFLAIHKPDTNLLAVVTVDAWNFMRISCVIKKDTIIYRGDFFKMMGQPIYKYKKGGGDFSKGVVNLEINTIIAGLLPKSSLLKEKINLNALTEEYIRWYLKEEM